MRITTSLGVELEQNKDATSCEFSNSTHVQGMFRRSSVLQFILHAASVNNFHS